MGVFVPFWQGGLNLRLVALVVSIQPFAYVVANYTCHDRNNESNKYIHRKVRAPSLCRYRGGNKINYSIIYFKSKRQKFYLHKCNFRSKIYFVVRRVAQFGRALRSGRRGRGFESRQGRQQTRRKPLIYQGFRLFLFLRLLWLFCKKPWFANIC